MTSPYLNRPLRPLHVARAEIAAARRKAKPRGMTIRHEIGFYLALGFIAIMLVWLEDSSATTPAVSPDLEAAALRMIDEARR